MIKNCLITDSLKYYLKQFKDSLKWLEYSLITYNL